MTVSRLPRITSFVIREPTDLIHVRLEHTQVLHRADNKPDKEKNFGLHFPSMKNASVVTWTAFRTLYPCSHSTFIQEKGNYIARTAWSKSTHQNTHLMLQKQQQRGKIIRHWRKQEPKAWVVSTKYNVPSFCQREQSRAEQSSSAEPLGKEELTTKLQKNLDISVINENSWFRLSLEKKRRRRNLMHVQYIHVVSDGNCTQVLSLRCHTMLP